MGYIDPLPESETPELKADFDLMREILGFVPNSVLTMQRRPKVVEGFAALTRGVMDPEGDVPLGFKRLIAHVASSAAGCQYCQAHTLVAADIHGETAERLAAIWDFRSSELFSEAEKVALEYSLAAGSVPNGVTADLVAQMKVHWTDSQIVEILAVVAIYGFLNRWNDSMATTLEDTPQHYGEQYLSESSWDGGKHTAGNA